MPVPLMHLLFNLAGFKLVWFMSLFGAGSGRPWLGAALLGLFMAVHFSISRNRRIDIFLILAAVLMGFLTDTLFARTGTLVYAEHLPFTGFAPFWILVMWANFALTLNMACRWLHGRPFLAALLGAVGGPLAYLAGVELGAAELGTTPMMAYATVAICWTLAVPALVMLATRLSGDPRPVMATV